MGLKDLFDKGKCLVGFHEGPWTHRSPAECTLVQRCIRCGQVSERVEHTWGDWAYQAEGSCTKRRVCMRCQQLEQSLEHVWGDAVYRQDGSCDRVAVCARCAEQESRKTEHRFDEWVYREEDDCTQVGACSRCGARGSNTRVQHSWADWTPSEFYDSQVRVCHQCGDFLVETSAGSVSMLSIEADANRLLAAQSPAELRSALTGTTLLEPAADTYFQLAQEQFPPRDEAASRHLAAARLLCSQCRDRGVDAVLTPHEHQEPEPAGETAHTSPAAQAQTATPAGALDARLFGHWRSTEFLGAGTSRMMPIETHCVLDPNGTFAFGTNRENVQTGTWRAKDSELTLVFANGVMTRLITLSGNDMVWPADRRYSYWRRIA